MPNVKETLLEIVSVIPQTINYSGPSQVERMSSSYVCYDGYNIFMFL